MREHYDALLNDPAQIEKILQAGAEKARAALPPLHGRAAPRRRPAQPRAAGQGGAARKAAKIARPSFKQYRESDGLFYFKLLDASGAQLLQSMGFASPQEAGRAIARCDSSAAPRLTLLAGATRTRSTMRRCVRQRTHWRRWPRTRQAKN